MNGNKNIHPDANELNGLLSAVSKKLGIPPEQLRHDLESGRFDSAMKGMNPKQAATFRAAVQNPKLVDQLMSTPQAKALYEKLTGGK